MSDIISNILSLVAIIISIYTNHRVTTIHCQDVQELLYSDVKHLLDNKCNFYSAEEKVIGVYTGVPYISENDEKAIERKVCRYFDKDEYEQLCEILNLCAKESDIECDIKMLFDAIKDGEPEKYKKLQGFLMNEEKTTLEWGQEKVNDFLSTVNISVYLYCGVDAEKTYNYLELRQSRNALNEQIKKKREELEKKMEEKMMTK